MPGIQKVLHYGSSNSDWESSEMFHLQRESLFYLLFVWALKCFVLAPADTIKPLFIIPSVSDSTITCFHFITCVFGSILREREKKPPRILLCNLKALSALTKSSTELHTSCLDAPRLWIQVFFLLLWYNFISTSSIFISVPLIIF